MLTKVWELTGLKNPESVIYDAKRDVLYVSNVNGAPSEKDGNGFISRLSPDGKLLDLEWIKGLNAPKGLALSKDKLYVTDIDTFVEIDLDKARIAKKYVAEKAKFLNDPAVDRAGNVYASDMMDDAIYRLSRGRFELWLKDSKLESPNGLYAEKDRLVVGSWGVMTNGFNTKIPGHLKTVSLKDKSIRSLGNGAPVGNLDGVEGEGHGAYFVTDWMAGKLYRIHPSGEADVLLTLSQGSADLTYIKDKKLLIIPMMNDNKLVAYKVE
ncbi:MAG: SMP-30/gluconolactonase/LRE family protein [Gammaproteobacteria bacterium]|nr:SMP-30/gluconolactonase/LRE family protein [Gammaproteobacteria bacterium]